MVPPSLLRFQALISLLWLVRKMDLLHFLPSFCKEFALLAERLPNPPKVVAEIAPLTTLVASQCVPKSLLALALSASSSLTCPNLTRVSQIRAFSDRWGPPLSLQAIVEPRRGPLCRALPPWPLRLPEVAQVVNLSGVPPGDALESGPYTRSLTVRLVQEKMDR